MLIRLSQLISPSGPFGQVDGVWVGIGVDVGELEGVGVGVWEEQAGMEKEVEAECPPDGSLL